VYYVKWEGYWHKENTWQNYQNVITHVEESLEEYHGKNKNTEKQNQFALRKSMG